MRLRSVEPVRPVKGLPGNRPWPPTAPASARSALAQGPAGNPGARYRDREGHHRGPGRWAMGDGRWHHRHPPQPRHPSRRGAKACRRTADTSTTPVVAPAWPVADASAIIQILVNAQGRHPAAPLPSRTRGSRARPPPARTRSRSRSAPGPPAPDRYPRSGETRFPIADVVASGDGGVPSRKPRWPALSSGRAGRAASAAQRWTVRRPGPRNLRPSPRPDSDI